MKVKSLKEAESWFEKNPGRAVTVEHGENSVNCSSLEDARKVFEEAKPVKGAK